MNSKSRFVEGLIIAFVVVLMTVLFAGKTKAEGRIVKPPTEYISFSVVRKILPRPYEEAATQEDLSSLMIGCESRMKAAHQMAEGARSLGYDEDNEIILLAKQEWMTAQKQYNYYATLYKSAGFDIWNQKAKEYPEATLIWKHLKTAGYSDAVCAGIMGNIMVESGGHSLDIQPMIYSKDKKYYGICQWSLFYYSNIEEKDLRAQCEYLTDTIESQISDYGRFFKKGFDFEKFLTLGTPEEAALAFAKTYERCNIASYDVRAECARIAFDYFSE